MKGAYGYVAYGVQGVFGTPAVAFSPLGIIGSANKNTRGGMEALKTVGQLGPAEIAEGQTSVEFRVSLAGVQDPQFLNLAKQDPATGLSWLTFRIGYDKGATEIYADLSDCKINTASLRLEAGGGLTADISAVGIVQSITAGDPGAMSYLSSKSYRWYNAVWSQAFDLRGFEFTVNNNVTPDFVIAGSGTTLYPLRGPVTMDEGSEDLTGRIRQVLANSALDLQDCLLPSSNETLTFTTCDDVSPEQVLTLSLNGFKVTDDNWTLPADGNFEAELPFMATGWDI